MHNGPLSLIWLSLQIRIYSITIMTGHSRVLNNLSTFPPPSPPYFENAFWELYFHMHFLRSKLPTWHWYVPESFWAARLILANKLYINIKEKRNIIVQDYFFIEEIVSRNVNTLNKYYHYNDTSRVYCMKLSKRQV